MSEKHLQGLIAAVGVIGEASTIDARAESRSATRAVLMGAVVLGVLMAAHLIVDAATRGAPWTNNDTAFFMYIGEQLRDGGRLYVDWHDTNMPSLYLIISAAVSLGRSVGLSDLLVYNLLTLLVATAGLLVLLHSLRHLGRGWSAMVLASAGYLFFVAKPGVLVRDFGQREHLFALLLIPEIFALASGTRARWRPVWCAALALMAMIKPHFALTVGLLELTAPRESRGRVQDLAGFVIGALMPFAWLLWHSAASFEALFTDTLDVHLAGVYALLNRSPQLLLARGPLLVLAASIAALGAMAVAAREDTGLRGLAGRGSLALLCCALAVVHQQKYTPYQFTPVFGVAVVFGAWAVGEWLAVRRQTVVAGIAAAVLAVTGAAMFHVSVSANENPLAVRLGRVVGGNPRLLVVSVYLHGLCTPFSEAPRCIGPQAYTVRLPQMARAVDRDDRLKEWASTVARQVRRHRPELVALSTSDLAMPEGMSPANLLLERFPTVSAGDYLPLTSAAMDAVGARGWKIFRRSDLPERTTAP